MKSLLSFPLVLFIIAIAISSCEKKQTTNADSANPPSIESFENNKNNQNKNRNERSCECNEPLKPAYDYYKVSSDKSYLETLHELYEYKEDKYKEKTDEMGITASVPNYGSIAYERNKKKIESIYKKYKEEIEYSLSYNEHVELSYMIVNEKIRLAAFSAFNTCMSICSKLPTLYIIENGKTDVILRFSIPITTQNQGQKFKIERIVSSSNLNRTNANDELKKDDVVQAGAERTISFKRLDTKSATVSIDIKNHPSVSVELNTTNQEYVYRWQSNDESGVPFKVVLRADIHYPSRTIELKNVTSGHTLKSFKMIENPADFVFDTNFDPDSVRINEVTSKSTGAKTKNREYVIVKDNMLRILSIVNYSKGVSQIDYNVYFQKKKPVAVRETGN